MRFAAFHLRRDAPISRCMNRVLAYSTRMWLAVMLSVVLVVTTHSMAVARAMPTATGTMTLCIGTGPVMVPMDSEGNPTGPAHICPEFSLSLMDAVAVPDTSAVPAIRKPLRNAVPEMTVPVRLAAVRPSARAPPVFV